MTVFVEAGLACMFASFCFSLDNRAPTEKRRLRNQQCLRSAPVFLTPTRPVVQMACVFCSFCQPKQQQHCLAFPGHWGSQLLRKSACDAFPAQRGKKKARPLLTVCVCACDTVGLLHPWGCCRRAVRTPVSIDVSLRVTKTVLGSCWPP